MDFSCVLLIKKNISVDITVSYTLGKELESLSPSLALYLTLQNETFTPNAKKNHFLFFSLPSFLPFFLSCVKGIHEVVLLFAMQKDLIKNIYYPTISFFLPSNNAFWLAKTFPFESVAHKSGGFTGKFLFHGSVWWLLRNPISSCPHPRDKPLWRSLLPPPATEVIIIITTTTATGISSILWVRCGFGWRGLGLTFKKWYIARRE